MKRNYLYSLLLLLAFLACSAKGQTLVSEWQFESNLVDSVSGNNGTILGEVTYVLGESGEAWNFGGGIVEIPDSASLDPSSKVTVQAWVKATGSPGDYKYIICKSDSSQDGVYAFETGGGGGIEFWVDAGVAGIQVSPVAPAASVWDGNWHRVTGVYDGTTVSLYLDGDQVGSGTPASGALNYTAPGALVFGDLWVPRGFAYAGSLDEVKMFNVAMTSSQVLANFNNPNDPSATNGLVSWWSAEGNANDNLGRNNGTVVSPPSVSYGPGESGTALFPQGGCVVVPEAANLLQPNITVQAWVNSSFPSVYRYIACQNGGVTGQSYALYTGGTLGFGAGFYVTTSADGQSPGSPDHYWVSPIAPGAQVWDGAWHQLTGTFDGTNVSIYVDGIPMGTTVVTNSSGIDYSNPGPLVIGDYAAVASSPLSFTGLIDDFKVYNGAMTPAQVLASYATNLVSWWRAAGTNADDSVGTNNGVLAEAAAYGLGRLNGLAFETSGGSVQIPDSSSLQIPSSLTLEAQVAASNPGANRAIIAKSATPSAASYGFTTGPIGGLEFFVTTSGTEITSPDAGTNLWDGNFHVIDGTYDGTKVHLYVDGVEAGSGTAVSGSIQYGETQNMGALIFGDDATSVSGANFHGAITQVKLFKMALTGYSAGLDVPHNALVVSQPQSQSVTAGGNAQFTASFRSYPNYSAYQWQFNGTNIPGATNLTLTVAAQSSTAGSYAIIETNGLLNYVPGEVGQAFDTSQGGVIRSSDAYGLYDLQTFTYQAWVRTTNFAPFSYIFSKSLQPNIGAPGVGSFGLWQDGGSYLGCYVSLETNSPFAGDLTFTADDTTTNIADGNWHQITATWDGEFLDLYVDGQQVHSSDSGGGLTIDYENAYLDGDLLMGDISAPPVVSLPTSYNPTHFKGQLDEVKVFNIAISSSAVNSTFNDPAGTSDPYDATNGLVSWWKGEGNTIDSWSSNSTEALLPPDVVSSDVATLTIISAPPTISNTLFNSNVGTFQATVSGPSAATNIVQRSYSLTGAVWVPIATNVVPFTFTDNIGTNKTVFYRAVSH
jgi:hypothetical protein